MKAKLIGGDRHRVEMEVHDGMPVIHFPELKEVEVSFDITASHHPPLTEIVSLLAIVW